MINVLSVIAFLALIVTLYQAAYVIIKVRGIIRLLFSAIAFCLSIWLFGSMMAFSAESVEQVNFYFRITVIGFCFLHAFLLHFILVFTGAPAFRSFYLFIYLPSLIIWLLGLQHVIVYESYVRRGDFWRCYPALDSPLTVALMIQYISYYCASIYLLLRKEKTAVSNRKKHQKRTIAAAVAATVFLFNLEPFVVPYLTGEPGFATAAIFSLVWTSTLWYSIIQQKLFIFTPAALLNIIINRTEFALFTADSEGRIVLVNDIASSMCYSDGSQITEISPFLESISSRNQLSENTESSDTDYIPDFSDLSSRSAENTAPVRSNMLMRYSNKPVIFRYCINQLTDSYDDIKGVVISGSIESLSLFHERYRLSKKEQIIASYIALGYSGPQIAAETNTSINTVKSQINSIFNKTGVNSKIELVLLLEQISSLGEIFETDT